MKTKLIFNIKNNYSNIYFEDYDDNGNLTDSGYRFFDVNVLTGSDEYELSSNDGVYIDGIGTYTKDDDGNKVYHTSEWSFSSCILDETCSNNSFYVNDTEIKLSSFDKDGKYTYDDDNVTYTIDIVNNNISFKSKDGSTTVSSCKLPLNYKTMQFVFSKQKEPTIEYELIKEKLSILDNKITEGFTTVETTQNDIKTDLDNKAQEIKDYFDKSKIDFTDIDGNFGSKYEDGDIVYVDGIKGIEWNVEKVTIYKDFRNHLNVMYLISSGDRKMLADEKILKIKKESE